MLTACFLLATLVTMATADIMVTMPSHAHFGLAKFMTDEFFRTHDLNSDGFVNMDEYCLEGRDVPKLRPGGDWQSCDITFQAMWNDAAPFMDALIKSAERTLSQEAYTSMKVKELYEDSIRTVDEKRKAQCTGLVSSFSECDDSDIGVGREAFDSVVTYCENDYAKGKAPSKVLNNLFAAQKSKTFCKKALGTLDSHWKNMFEEASEVDEDDSEEQDETDDEEEEKGSTEEEQPTEEAKPEEFNVNPNVISSDINSVVPDNQSTYDGYDEEEEEAFDDQDTFGVNPSNTKPIVSQVPNKSVSPQSPQLNNGNYDEEEEESFDDQDEYDVNPSNTQTFAPPIAKKSAAYPRAQPIYADEAEEEEESFNQESPIVKPTINKKPIAPQYPQRSEPSQKALPVFDDEDEEDFEIPSLEKSTIPDATRNYEASQSAQSEFDDSEGYDGDDVSGWDELPGQDFESDVYSGRNDKKELYEDMDDMEYMTDSSRHGQRLYKRDFAESPENVHLSKRNDDDDDDDEVDNGKDFERGRPRHRSPSPVIGQSAIGRSSSKSPIPRRRSPSASRTDAAGSSPTTPRRVRSTSPKPRPVQRSEIEVALPATAAAVRAASPSSPRPVDLPAPKTATKIAPKTAPKTAPQTVPKTVPKTAPKPPQETVTKKTTAVTQKKQKSGGIGKRLRKAGSFLFWGTAAIAAFRGITYAHSKLINQRIQSLPTAWDSSKYSKDNLPPCNIDVIYTSHSSGRYHSAAARQCSHGGEPLYKNACKFPFAAGSITRGLTGLYCSPVCKTTYHPGIPQSISATADPASGSAVRCDPRRSTYHTKDVYSVSGKLGNYNANDNEGGQHGALTVPHSQLYFMHVENPQKEARVVVSTGPAMDDTTEHPLAKRAKAILQPFKKYYSNTKNAISGMWNRQVNKATKSASNMMKSAEQKVSNGIDRVTGTSESTPKKNAKNSKAKATTSDKKSKGSWYKPSSWF